ncbi:MAG: serine hydrolase domain-containing protein [Acidimicrobiales bacterium]
MASTTTTLAPSVVPGPEWDRADPAEAGFDPDGVVRLTELAIEADSNCLVVVRDGRLVVEEYWFDWTEADDQEVFSATKSVTALVVGIAQDLGYLSIDEAAATYLTEWEGTESEDVTIRDLLTNTSGRYWDFTTDYVDMVSADDRSAFAIALDQQHDPDTVWVYNNSAIQTLEEVVQRATGTDFGDFAQEHLFGPLEMGVEFARDPAGNPGAFFSLQAGCLDMARLGLLALEDGRWGSQQVVSAPYMAEATTTSNQLNSAYGYLWWLNADAGWVHPDPRRDTSGAFWPDAPSDAYAALGLGQQVLAVLPSQNVVVVRLGSSSAAGAQGAAGELVNDLAGLTADAVVD